MRCERCGAVLHDTDRWCDACDAPNLKGRFFGRFRSPIVDVELDEAARGSARPRLQAGQRPCPRCGLAIEQRQHWCEGCGCDITVVRPTSSRDPLDGVWRTPGPDNLDPYRAIGGLGVVFRLVLLAAIVTFAGTAAVYLLWYLRLDAQLPSPSIDVAVISSWVGTLNIAASVVGFVGLLTAVLWTNRAYRNLPALGVRGLRFSPEIVGASWLVPGVDLVVPKLVLDELWRGSDPGTRSGSRHWRTQAAPTVAHVGWIALLAGVPAAVMVALASPITGALRVPELRLRLLLGSSANVCLLIGVACLWLVVGQIGERQAERARRLGPAEILPLRQRLESEHRVSGASRPAALLDLDRLDLEAYGPDGPIPATWRRHAPDASVYGRY